MEIKLKNNQRYRWEKNQGFYVKGNINNEVQLRLDEYTNPKKLFEEVLMSSSRFHSIILETEKYVYAAVDHLRMHPLFYSIKNGNAYLSDDANWVKRCSEDKEMNELSEVEFLMTGYVTGNNTLYESVNQLQAGEYLIYNRTNKKVELIRYDRFSSSNEYSFNKEMTLNQLDQIHINLFQRLITTLNGRTAVLPLSGGYDSRVIAMMLKRLGYEKVICFTYGKPGNSEAKVSKEIADYLNFKWIFVPYNGEKWKRWYASDKRKEYFDISNGLTSLPHIQDHMAIGELKEKNLIPKDSVIIPGHTAILSFADYDKSISSVKQATLELFNKHYSLWNWSHKNNRKFKRRLEDRVNQSIESFINQGQTIENAVYLWEMSERHSKFICNSVRTYEQYGYEWELPLWEKELVDFWLNVPQKFRINKILYKDYFEKYFALESQGIVAPNSESNIRVKALKEKIRGNDLLYNVSLKLRKVLAYWKHPFDWYKIIQFNKYLYGLLKGAANINSYLVEKQIHYLKRKPKD